MEIFMLFNSFFMNNTGKNEQVPIKKGLMI